MKVKCKTIFDERGKILEYSAWIKKGKVYHVLDIYYEYRLNRFITRLIGEEGNTPALHDLRQFEVTSNIIPDNWIIDYQEGKYFGLSPEPWTKDGFWELYFDGDPDAIRIFKEEQLKILVSDP